MTGASRGIGKAIALALGRCKAKVACVARDTAKLAETVSAITSAGGQAEAFACDVTNGEAVQELVESIAEKWGRLDILVNNAGITRDTLLPRMGDDQWDEVINTNLRGTFLFTRAATRPMMSQRYGRIINISSVSGLIGNAGQANYSASKAGHDRVHAHGVQRAGRAQNYGQRHRAGLYRKRNDRRARCSPARTK